MNEHGHRRGAARDGFTLIEIIVVITVISILAGAAIPVAAKVLAAQSRKATREEMRGLADASLEFFRDTNNPPHAIVDLEVDPKAAYSKGWAGPYLPGVVADPLSQKSGYRTDAWSHDYAVEYGAGLSITSLGEDGVAGGGNDIPLDVDFTPIRREETQDELRILNQAIVLYNGVYQATKPLSTTWKTALDQLVSKGFLPDSTDYLTDAWGDAYLPDPEGKSPLVKVQSKSLNASSSETEKTEKTAKQGKKSKQNKN